MLSNDDSEQTLSDLLFQNRYEQIRVEEVISKTLQVVLSNNSSKLTKWCTNISLHKGYSNYGNALSNHYPCCLIFPTSIDKQKFQTKKMFFFSKVDWLVENDFHSTNPSVPIVAVITRFY